MRNFYILINNIIIFIQIKNSIQSHITFPFKKSTKKKNIFPENLLQNDLEITLLIGTPPQKVNLNLRSKAYTFFITSSEVNLPYQTFNENKSTTLIKETKKPDEYLKQEYNKGYKIYETITINDIQINNVSLILATSLVYEQPGALGLKLVESHEFAEDLSFIYQIKQNVKFGEYSFFINYFDDNNGELIIGTYPHLYNNTFDERNFVFQKAGKNNNNVDWIIEFDFIKYNNETIERIITKSLIQIEFGLIKAPFKLKKYFNEKFFKNKCDEEFDYLRNISLFYCDKNFDITNFKNLTFILKDINFKFDFSYHDLFIKNDSNFIFSIVFDNNTENSSTTWILGKVFMKKHQFIFDMDRKIIGIYNGYSNSNGFNFYLFSLIILIIIIICLVYYMYFYLKKPRKIRANELEDDNFLYIPSN